MSFDIYLIRHPKPDIAPGTCYGAMDMPPVAQHLQQVIDFVQAKLPLEQLKHYSSPLQRARLVAEGVGAAHDIVPAIAEMGFGRWEGLHWDNIPNDEIEAWNQDFMHYQAHGGESVASFYQRVEHFIDETLLSDGKDAVLFTHAGVIRSFLHYTGDLSLKRGNHTELDYGSINHLRYAAGALKAVSLNMAK